MLYTERLNGQVIHGVMHIPFQAFSCNPSGPQISGIDFTSGQPLERLTQGGDSLWMMPYVLRYSRLIKCLTSFPGDPTGTALQLLPFHPCNQSNDTQHQNEHLDLQRRGKRVVALQSELSVMRRKDWGSQNTTKTTNRHFMRLIEESGQYFMCSVLATCRQQQSCCKIGLIHKRMIHMR